MDTVSMSFSIEGQFLTEFVRGLVLDGEWRKALDSLKDSLPGMTTDQAVSILDGSKRLVGVNNLELVDQDQDDPELANYLNTLEFQFRSIVEWKFKHYRPYAYVSNFGREDIPKDGGPLRPKKKENTTGRPSISVSAKRALHYADDPENDIVVFLEVNQNNIVKDQPVLFKRVDRDLPVWMKTNRDFQITLEDNWLQDRGYTQKYGTNQELHEMRIKSGDVDLVETPDPSQLRPVILAQAGDDFVEHTFPDPVGTVKIPRVPLWNWAMSRTGREPLPWTVISPMGVKMLGDDRIHSDWMIGAGINLDAYGDEQYRAAQYELLRDIQKQEMGFDVSYLVVGKMGASGVITHPKEGDICTPEQIAVIPNAGTRWYETVRNAAGIICENGGAMSHLAVVGLEEGLLVALQKDARRIFPEGTLVAMNGQEGSIEVMAFDERYSLDKAREKTAELMRELMPTMFDKYGSDKYVDR